MGADDVCYNQAWTEKAIEELDMELRLVKELYLDVQALSQLPLQSETIIFDILAQIESLERSLGIARKALHLYMEAAESQMAKAVSIYEEALRKSSSLFAEH